MLAEQLKTIGVPFYAARYWLELWDLGNRPVSFGGFEALLRPPVDDDDVGAVRSPCAPELALIAAVGDLRVIGGRFGSWTDRWSLSLDGWRGYDIDGAPPDSVVTAIERAYPLPTTFREAHDEYAYWAWRAFMITMVDAEDGAEGLDALLEPELDLVCQVRVERIRRLLVSDVVECSIEDVLTKQRMYAFVDGRDYKLEASMMRDLGRLKQVAARPAPSIATEGMIAQLIVKVSEAGMIQPVVEPPTPKPVKGRAKKARAKKGHAKKGRKRTGCRTPGVIEALLRTPRPTDHAIARKFRVATTTVGNARRRLIEEGKVDPMAPAFVERRNVPNGYLMDPRGKSPTKPRRKAVAKPASDVVEQSAEAGTKVAAERASLISGRILARKKGKRSSSLPVVNEGQLSLLSGLDPTPSRL